MRPVRNSVQKIQDTFSSWGRNTWKCRSAGVLPQEEGVHLFDSTGSSLPSTQESKELSSCWVYTEREIVVNWDSHQENKLTVCHERLKNNLVGTDNSDIYLTNVGG